LRGSIFFIGEKNCGKITLLKNSITSTLFRLSKTNLNNSSGVKTGGLFLEKQILNQNFTYKKAEGIITFLQKNNSLMKLQQLYETFETNLENKFAERILREKLTTYHKYLLYDRFRILLTNEIQLAKIKSSDRIAFIGSGPLPISAFLLSSLSGCHIECYEKEPSRVELSIKVIRQLGLANQIKVLNNYGENLNDNNYSTILIALLAKPKDKIIQSIKKHAKPGTKVICRTSHGIREIFYEATDAKLLNNLKIKYNYAQGNQTISSAMFIL